MKRVEASKEGRSRWQPNPNANVCIVVFKFKIVFIFSQFRNQSQIFSS